MTGYKKEHTHNHAHVTGTLPRPGSASLLNTAGLTSRSVGWQPVPAVQSASHQKTSSFLATSTTGILTSIHNRNINTDIPPRPFIHPSRPDLLPTQRILIRITARLRSIESIMRYRNNHVVVR
jgi:hypothetical protein